MARPKGVPIDREEVKERHAVMLTPTAWKLLGEIAQAKGFKSKSDLIEAIARGELTLHDPSQKMETQD